MDYRKQPLKAVLHFKIPSIDRGEGETCGCLDAACSCQTIVRCLGSAEKSPEQRPYKLCNPDRFALSALDFSVSISRMACVCRCCRYLCTVQPIPNKKNMELVRTAFSFRSLPPSGPGPKWTRARVSPSSGPGSDPAQTFAASVQVLLTFSLPR